MDRPTTSNQQRSQTNTPSTNSENRFRLVEPETGHEICLSDRESPGSLELDSFLKMIHELKTSLTKKNNECELLKIKVDEYARTINSINQELNKCKFTVFEMNQDSVRNKERSMKLKQLEERFEKLTNDFILSCEENKQFQAKTLDRYIAKSNAINYMECQQINQKELLLKLQQDLDIRSGQLRVAEAELSFIREENAKKDRTIAILKNSYQEIQNRHRLAVLKLDHIQIPRLPHQDLIDVDSTEIESE